MVGIVQAPAMQPQFMDNPAMPTPPQSALPPALLWDVFCRVVDNFGDLGVCWRLAMNLAERGHRVRLWVDDASALPWMAPGALEGQWPSIEILSWTQTQDPTTLSKRAVADVWVETFGCAIAPEFIAAGADCIRATGQNVLKVPIWINLEYLTAEDYAERTHLLPSPVLHGPAAGWTKYFYYPGFTLGTGGLLRELDLLTRQAAFDRASWLAQLGIAWTGQRLVSLFCYEPTHLADLLQQLRDDPTPTLLLVTQGRAARAVKNLEEKGLQPLCSLRGQLSISYLPQLSQRDFDHLLWACDCNFVRGEDSVVRALWAGKPLVWQIYPQDDAAHHDKLEAFLDMLAADTTLRQFHRVWNDTMPGANSGALPPLNLDTWQTNVAIARSRLLQMDDLVTQLVDFVSKKR
jgi:uncharacterized repeat protein (TIGR03837 family)